MSLCEPSELASLLSGTGLDGNVQTTGSNDLIVLYTTMTSGPGVIPDIVKESQPAYIPTSIFFDFQTVVVDKTHPSKHMMPSKAQFQSQVRKLGINNTSTIVVYDDFGNFCASRVWFMFKTLGHENIRVLDGGLPLWLKQGRKTVKQCLCFDDVNKQGNFVARPSQHYRFVSKQDIIENNMNEIPFFDARSKARFNSNDSDKNVRLEKNENAHHRPKVSGHIPGMQHLHYRDVQTSDGRFLPIKELSRLIPEKSPLGFSCGSGVTACILAQAAHIAGRHEILVYDGSWSEWSADDTLPIE